MMSCKSGRARRNAIALPICLLLTVGVTFAQPEQSEDQKLGSIHWVAGPTQVSLGTCAELQVPAGYGFANASDCRKLLELAGNPTDGSELGLVKPVDGGWFITFEFSDVGYVKDEDSDKLDADAILKSVQEGTEAANKIRRENGWAELEILGWQQTPHYDAATRNLVWAIRGQSEDAVVINYNTRRLGRTGVMSVALVCDPDELQTAVPKFNTLMSGFAFVAGKKYEEFRVGDKIAEYGLTALITGGAAAIAVKSGLFKWIWKLLIVAVIAVGALFKRLFGRRKTETPPPTPAA